MRAVAEAPSKAILTGEHFVVHGAWGLAAALPRRIRVEAQKAPRFSVQSNAFSGPRNPALIPVGRVVEKMAMEYSFNPRIKVSISSTVPGGAGLGSSASTMVALTAALGKLNSLHLSVDEVIRTSMIGEEHIHGRPSGIDSTICTMGGLILFKPGSKPRKVPTGPRSLVISFSGMSRSTLQQIGHVAKVKESFPSFFEGLTRTANAVSLLAAERLSAEDMPGVGTLFNFSHAILSVLGVSTATLDKIVSASMALGSYGAKLTGAGGGGSVISVCPEGKEKSIIAGLKRRGFETISARIPVEGVKSWLEP
jgi:mevalonate kinase